MDSSQIVSCSGLDCSVCGIMEVVSNLFRYLMGIAGIVAVLLLILAGFMFIFNLGKEKELNKAKAVAKYAIFGFIVTLVSFLVIYSLYKITGASDKGNWFQIDCTVESLEQQSNLQKQQEVEQKFEFINAGSVFPTAEDPRKITNLDVASLNPQNLLFDSLELLPGQMIRFIVSDKNLNESEINDYVSSEKGFFVLPGADRAIGTGTDEIIKIIRDGDIIRIVSEGENSEILGEFGANDESEQSAKVFNQVISLLSEKKNQGKNIYLYNDRNQEEQFNFDEAACKKSGGEVMVFQSECEARKEACGQKSILCNDKESELMGCQCPVGSCLKDQKCVKIEGANEPTSQNDQDNDGILDSKDRCPNTPEGETINTDKTSADYGCACSQLKLTDRVCPPSRCEGPNLITYLSDGKDTCDSGKRTLFACNPTSQFNQQCQQAFLQKNQPTYPTLPSGTGNQSSNRPGSSPGGQRNSGGQNQGSSPDNSGQSQTSGNSPTSPSTSPSTTPSELTKPLTLQEAFDGGNGSLKDPFVMSEKAMEEVFSYNEQTGKLDLDKNWESKLGVLGKDYYVKIPEKEKIMKAVDKKRKEKGKKELTDEQKEKLKNDKDAVKAPKGVKVVNSKDNKEKTVDPKANKDDPSKTSEDSLDEKEQLLKARTAGDPNYEPQTAREKWAAEHGLVKAEDGTFKSKSRGATDYFTPDMAGRLKRASEIAEEYGKGIHLTSGFRGGEGINPNSSRHNSGQAVDIAFTGETMTQQNKALLENIMAQAGLKVLRWPSIYEWWHFSPDGH